MKHSLLGEYCAKQVGFGLCFLVESSGDLVWELEGWPALYGRGYVCQAGRVWVVFWCRAVVTWFGSWRGDQPCMAEAMYAKQVGFGQCFLVESSGDLVWELEGWPALYGRGYVCQAGRVWVVFWCRAVVTWFGSWRGDQPCMAEAMYAKQVGFGLCSGVGQWWLGLGVGGVTSPVWQRLCMPGR